MDVILDTHVLIWWLENPSNLHSKSIEVIENIRNSIYISSASIWEITIKESIGKLRVNGDIMKAIEESQFIPLSISIDHVNELRKLPLIHSDPFDRMMIAQARHENFLFMTRDKKIEQYDVNLINA